MDSESYGTWSRKQMLSTEEGESGGERVNSSPIPGVEESPGVPAKSITSILKIIASRAVPLLAKLDRSGIIKASRDVEDPVAVEASEKGDTVATLSGGKLSATQRPTPGDIGAVAKAGDSMGGPLQLSGDPTSPLHAATMQYVDAARAGLDTKASVRAATTANVDLAAGGLLTVDGVALTAGNRVLVKNQTAPAENGIYLTAATGAWARATDANTSAKVSAGLYTFVEEGTTYADQGWVLATNDPITLGTTALSFTQFTGAGAGTPDATESTPGKVQLATEAQVQAGTPGLFVASVARLAAEITRRLTPEAWHVIGAAGEPAFQNGWLNFGGTFDTAGYRKDPLGRVHLKGKIKSGTGNTTIFTLPAGYQPAAGKIFSVVTASGAGHVAGRVDVYPDGRVVLLVGGNIALSLENVSFEAA